MREMKLIDYKGIYPIVMKDRLLGVSSEGEECKEQRVFMYLGSIRLDITDMNSDDVRMAVNKLELMGMTNESA